MDNPSNFTFYFDTSRRRYCYLAPERFQTTSEVQRLPGEYSEFTEGLTHEMDVYSMACVIIELYTDGKCPFYFGDQLLSYVLSDDSSPAVTEYVTTALQGVPEPLHPLLRVMLAKDPQGRRGWLEEFDKLNGPYFPNIFDDFVYEYFQSFRAKPPTLTNLATLSDAEQPTSGKILSMEADETISKLSSDFSSIWEKLEAVGGTHPDIVVLFVSLLTSELRALRSLPAKLEAVRLLKKFAEISSAYIVTERILPSLICSLFDPFVHVRCEAIYLLADTVELLKESPKEGYRLFADYLFPKLKNAANDKSVYVRMALAHNLGRFAQCSLRFIRDLTSTLSDVETFADGSDSELDTPAKAKQTLQQAINEIFVALCTNGDNNVRLCLVSQNTTLQLCDFFAVTDGTYLSV
uniref:Protein kinase domain-containing protein n=1 Tax=Steinernema glaseri TaxID=37863 RepID=A0A1I7ZP08_9BILA